MDCLRPQLKSQENDGWMLDKDVGKMIKYRCYLCVERKE